MPAPAAKFVNFSAGWSILGSMEGPSISDPDLVALARAGEMQALAGLLERYRPSLYAAAIATLRNRDDALDAVQETCMTALLKLGSLRDPAAVGGWLHAVLRNTCLTRLRSRREVPHERVDPLPLTGVPAPDDALDRLVDGELVWAALDALSTDDRETVMLRYFSRCRSYEQIACITGAPVGTVRSRLHRSRALLSHALQRTVIGTAFSHAELERTRRNIWEQFYAELHDAPVPGTYRDTYASDVEVTDSVGHWQGVKDWSAHEREAIGLGVRARVQGVVVSRDLTIIEIDFLNPESASDHCPPRSTFVHHLEAGRSRRLDIHYV
ncbi:MAG TPA: RNA polymerase sigma factor [Acidimicrobiia bacterium]|jgi:RNA polymerase sigma-70 factor (ECF subfamily)